MKNYRVRWTCPDDCGKYIYSVVSYDLTSAQERLSQGNLPERAEIVRVKPGTDDVIEVL